MHTPPGTPIIAIDTTPELLGGGGVATYARELRTGLAGRGDLDVVEIRHELTGAGSTIRRIGGGLAREGWYYPFGAERAARRAGADLLHVPASTPALTRALPLVVTIHDAIPWRNPEWFTRANATQQRMLVTRTARRATRVITDSAASRDDLMRLLGIDPDRIDVIPLGVSSRFSPALRDPDWLRSRFAVSGPIVLSVGTPEPRKNLRGALDVFERVMREIPEATLLLVGGGGWRHADIDRRIEDHDARVVRAGRLSDDDLARVYASADCFLFPSLREGFGFPPLEAMASGLPVVCSDSPSLPEVVGDAAITAESADVDRLAAGVVGILSDAGHRDRLIERGIRQSAGFTWQRTVDLTVDAYRRALQ